MAGARLRPLRADQKGGQDRHRDAGHVHPVDEAGTRTGQQQPGHARATAAPATWPIWNNPWNMALTVATSQGGTRFGRIADSPDSVVAVKPAATAGKANNGHSTGPVSALTARPALHNNVSSCAPS